MVDEESLGTGIEKAREKVVKLPKIITCTKGGGKCGDASGALCAQRGCKRSADARARGAMCGRKCVVPWWRWDARMQALDVRHSQVCRMPHTGHAGTKRLCRERRRTGVCLDGGSCRRRVDDRRETTRTNMSFSGLKSRL